jgi:N-acetylmuramoyl-L-alanine amidase
MLHNPHYAKIRMITATVSALIWCAFALFSSASTLARNVDSQAASNQGGLYQTQSPQAPNVAMSELTGMHFFIDPGHGGANAPGAPNALTTMCQEQGTSGPAGTTERRWTLEMAFALGPPPE